jgi:hypothetical protein
MALSLMEESWCLLMTTNPERSAEGNTFCDIDVNEAIISQVVDMAF